MREGGERIRKKGMLPQQMQMISVIHQIRFSCHTLRATGSVHIFMSPPEVYHHTRFSRHTSKGKVEM